MSTLSATAGSTSPPAATGQARGGAVLRSSRGLAMPIFQTVAFSGTFFAITKVPGFPTDRSVNWYLPLACCMGSGFAGVGLGFSTVRDIESGFFDRLRMAPSPRISLIVGPLFTAWIRVMIVITTALIVGFAFGARLTDGVLGLVTLYVAGLGVATVAAGWGLGLAYRFGDMRAAALMQLTLFNALFLTNAQSPLNVMTGWLHSVARINPFTNILRLGREGWLGEVSWQSTWGGLVAIVGLSVLTLTFAYRGLAKLSN